MKNKINFHQYSSYKSDEAKELYSREEIVDEKYNELKLKQNIEMKNKLCEKCKNLPEQLKESMKYCSRVPKWSEVKLCEKCKQTLNNSWKDWTHEFIFV